ncbi:MAG: ADP-forming succinate--CoA ligase subunit beta [Thermodesulfobacteriota bacterium]|nr:ADP-forming succinate--CoA ligase subunit beta [Thermodesulfobacteriota bacterium]
MKIHEFQAKKILKKYKVPIPRGEVAKTPAKAQKVAEKLGGKVVVKAQIHAGGRGKGGGVKVVANPAEALEAAKQIIGMNLVTHQTGPEGQKVKQVLIEEGLDVVKELYVGIVVDRAQAAPVIMVSEAGGMDIEEIAATSPEKILKVAVDPATGFMGFHARKLSFGLGFGKDLMKQAFGLFSQLYTIFVEKDATLVEINPLIITSDNRLIALDAKMTFDDDALFRHPDIDKLYDEDELDPLEVEASGHKLNYIKLDGNVGCMVNGAGLAMATMDIIKLAGGSPANFLDVGGGASAEQVENAFRILLADKNVKVVLINIFGGILRCDRVATGMVEAAKKVDLSLPMVVRLEGTNVEEGRKILRDSGLKFEVATDFRDAAEKVADITKTITL